MPALFAYLLAVGLLLGGGYGALSWLATPEPVKMARAKPRPHYRVSSEAGTARASSPAVNDNEEAATTSNGQRPSSASELGLVASDQAEPSRPAPDQQTRFGNSEALSHEAAQHAEASPDVAKESDRQPAQAALQGLSGNAQSAGLAPTEAAKTVAPPRPRRANQRSEKRALALMTLRTIEYPDGHRVTRLIPYRGGERALAFQSGQLAP